MRIFSLLVILALSLSFSSHADADEPSVEPLEEVHELHGLASWYAGKFQGRLTANGERFDTNMMTAAHKTLPFNTVVQVTNLDNGLTTVVRINDRGPFVDNRIIDLSRAAADAIGLTAAGVGMVRLEILHLQKETQLRTIQVGSYSQRGNAEAVAARLERGGFSPVIQQVANQRVHRVLIQSVPEDEIDAYRARLREIGFSQVLVRTK